VKLLFNGRSLPTKYNGVTFRSRLEARWAVFFDHMGIRYLYEPKRVTTPLGWYIPDFYLPDLQTFWIVKGDEIDKAEEQKVDYLASKGYGAVIARGELPHELNGGYPGHDKFYGWVRHSSRDNLEEYGLDGATGNVTFRSRFHWDNETFFGKCKYCGAISLTHGMRIGRICQLSGIDDPLHGTMNYDPKANDHVDFDSVYDALDAARNHKF
jgi:hypothetical protein